MPIWYTILDGDFIPDTHPPLWYSDVSWYIKIGFVVWNFKPCKDFYAVRLLKLDRAPIVDPMASKAPPMLE